MEKRQLLYEGKAKRVYETDDKDLLIVHYKDDATAFDGKKRGQILQKGVYNNKMSAFFFEKLSDAGIPTHHVRVLNERESLVKGLEIVKVEVVMRNIVAGSLAKRTGLPEGTMLPFPVLEHYYKSDELGDPLINEYHIRALGLATQDELDTIAALSFKVNDNLRAITARAGLDLVDFKLEYGRHHGQILLGDEISPDTCRFWDSETKERLDKDRFRRDLGKVEEAYQEVLRRLMG
jgi:phosphoribosylaminoimidazole-succinocarboxamide synthase